MRLITSVVFVVVACLARDAAAQARATIVPSISAGSVFDDNLFTQRSGSGDLMNVFTPSLEADWDSPSRTILSQFSFDMQRSLSHSVLNTFDARRHAFLDARLQTSPLTTLSLGGTYDRSRTPGELNIETGILNDRQLADRWQVTPGFDYRPNTRTMFSTNYSWTRETLQAPFGDINGNVHVARVTVSRQVTERGSVNVGYLGRMFVDGPDLYHSNAALVGWTYEMAPGTSVTLQGGPRMTSYAGLAPEIVASFARKTDHIKATADYWHGETIVVGITGPVAVHSATAGLSSPIKRQLELGAHVGVFDSATLTSAEARVYHASLVSAWSPGGPYTIAASYGVDFQKGDVRSVLFSNNHVLRNVFLVKVTVAPRISHSFLPPDEAARAKGVSR